MRPAWPGNFSVATQSSRPSKRSLNRPHAGALSIRCKPRISLGAGGCDFTDEREKIPAPEPQWSAQSTPTVISLIGLPEHLLNSAFLLSAEQLGRLSGRGQSSEQNLSRVEASSPIEGPVAVVLPLDRLFDIRVTAALQLWRFASGHGHIGPNPARLSAARFARLILALRALDGRFDKASYRAIADALFDTSGITGTAWKTHDLRDRTIRLVRSGMGLMDGGYRRLLLYPFRGAR